MTPVARMPQWSRLASGKGMNIHKRLERCQDRYQASATNR